MTAEAPGLPEEGQRISSLCWFPWFPKDWLTSDTVGRMNDAQIVAYFWLLNRQWLCTGGLLPDDLDILSKYAGHDMRTADMKKVLERFPVVAVGARANPRLLALYERQQKRHAMASAAAQKRWDEEDKKDTQTHMRPDMPSHMRRHIQGASVSVSVSGSSSVPERGVGKTKQFKRPTPEQVEEYAKSIGYQVDGEYFCDSYEAKGWIVGRTHMKDWMAAVRTWKGRSAELGGRCSPGKTSSRAPVPKLTDYQAEAAQIYADALNNGDRTDDIDRAILRMDEGYNSFSGYIQMMFLGLPSFIDRVVHDVILKENGGRTFKPAFMSTKGQWWDSTCKILTRVMGEDLQNDTRDEGGLTPEEQAADKAQ